MCCEKLHSGSPQVPPERFKIERPVLTHASQPYRARISTEAKDKMPMAYARRTCVRTYVQFERGSFHAARQRGGWGWLPPPKK